jgi:predicted naringenin-chalcone synthase
MSLVILGVGTALPETPVSQTEAMNIARTVCCRTDAQETWIPTLYTQSGIETRHMAFPDNVLRDLIEGTANSGSVFLPKRDPADRGPTAGQRMRHYVEQAGPLATRAARQALAASGVDPADITHIVTVSCTGFRAPGVDVEIIKRLGLPATVQRTHIGFMGCHGALNGLRVARAYAESDPRARILLCAVELCGIHYHYGWDPQKVIANALFADGAAALVGAAGVDAASCRIPAKRQDAASTSEGWRVEANGACLFPDSEDAMTWSIGDYNFEMTLSKRVPGLIAEGLKPWLETWLNDSGVSLSEVASWAVHPGGPRILTAVEEGLGLASSALAPSRAVLADCGNMSSPTVLFVLERTLAQGFEGTAVLAALGPGFTASFATLHVPGR